MSISLVSGLLLDTLELDNAVKDDLKDADKTGMVVTKIGGRWVEAVIGAELGLAGGIAGAIGGEEFVN